MAERSAAEEEQAADQGPVCWVKAEPLAAEPGRPACVELGVEVGLGSMESGLPAGRWC